MKIRVFATNIIEAKRDIDKVFNENASRKINVKVFFINDNSTTQ